MLLSRKAIGDFGSSCSTKTWRTPAFFDRENIAPVDDTFSDIDHLVFRRRAHVLHVKHVSRPGNFSNQVSGSCFASRIQKMSASMARFFGSVRPHQDFQPRHAVHRREFVRMIVVCELNVIAARFQSRCIEPVGNPPIAVRCALVRVDPADGQVLVSDQPACSRTISQLIPMSAIEMCAEGDVRPLSSSIRRISRAAC